MLSGLFFFAAMESIEKDATKTCDTKAKYRRENEVPKMSLKSWHGYLSCYATHKSKKKMFANDENYNIKL